MESRSDAVHVRVKVTRADDSTVLRVGSLSLEFAAAVTEDAVGKAPASLVVVTLPAHASDRDVTEVEERFSRLRSHGIVLTVVCGELPSAVLPPTGGSDGG